MVAGLALAALLASVFACARAIAWAFAFGLAWGALTLAFEAKRLQADASWLARPWTITARVVRSETRQGYARAWLADVVREDGARLAGLVRVSTRRPLAHGMHIRAKVRLRRCRPRQNPGAWDFAAWCRAHGIALVGSLRGEPQLLRGPDLLGRMRAHLREAFAQAPHAARPWLFALVLGERGLWRADALDRFAAAGLAHLLAISGLHVGVVGAAGAMLAGGVARLAPRLLAWQPARVWGAIGGVALAWGYVALAGAPVSALRAALMLTIAAVAWALGRLAEGVRALALAFALLAVVSPAATESVGFWLSFAGTLALVLLPRAPRGRLRRLGYAGIAALAAHTATLPWTLARFGWLAPYAVPANLVAGALFPALLLAALAAALAALLGAEAVAGALFALVDALGRALAHGAAWFSGLAGGMLLVRKPDAAALGITALALGIALGLLGRKRLAWAAVLMLAAQLALGGLLLAERHPKENALWVWDVGQGAASALFTAQGGVMLVDAPGRWNAQITGGHIAAQALRTLGVLHADLFVITHAQSDHGGGAPALLRRLHEVKALALPDVPEGAKRWFMRAAMHEARRKGARVLRLGRGDHLRLEGAEVEVLWPPHGAPLRGNAASLVLRVRAGKHAILFPADIPARVERRLVSQLARTEIVLAPHHGSRSSSSPAFVRALHPRLVIVQAGWRNRWGFPHAEVVARWRQAGARVLVSYEGAIQVRLASGGVVPAQWHRPPDAKAQAALRGLQRLLESAGRSGGGGSDAGVH